MHACWKVLFYAAGMQFSAMMRNTSAQLYSSGWHLQMECAETERGETWYNDFIKQYLRSCGVKCSNIRILPIYELSLSRHKSHIGPLQGKTLNCKHCSWDCRHFCSNVLHTWNLVLYNSLCS